MKTRLLGVIDRFIPAAVQANPDLFYRARLLIGMTLFMAVTSPLYAVGHLVAGANLQASVAVLQGIGFAIVPWLYRRTERLSLSTHVFATALFGLLVYKAWLAGGFTIAGAASLAWLLACPLAATLVAGPRAGWTWGGLVLAVFAMFYGLFLTDYALPSMVGADEAHGVFFTDMIGIVLAVTVMSVLAFVGKTRALDAASVAQAEAEQAAACAQKLSRELEGEKVAVEDAMAAIERQKAYLASSVDRVVEQMRRLAQGDLTVHLEASQDDEIGVLYRGFNASVAQMASVLQQVTEAVHEASEATTAIRGAANALAQQAEQQANRARTVRQSVQAMADSIQHSADEAGRVASVAEDSGAAARESDAIIGETLDRMTRLSSMVQNTTDAVGALRTRSEAVGDIATVIADIADQSNLLALNASIEAARAGEHGRGFSIVADEMRKLSVRTSDATREIGELIQTIQAEVDQTTAAVQSGNSDVEAVLQLSDQAGAALARIIPSTEAVLAGVNTIAEGAEQQSGRGAEISAGIEQMTHEVEASTDQVVRIAETADRVDRLTDVLREQVAQFKTPAVTIQRRAA
ncbi:MAG: methyl-accepting chemotaxis protein [Bacteroidota bacterium]